MPNHPDSVLSASRDANKTIEVLSKISNAVNSTNNLGALYREIHHTLGDILNVDNIAIAIHHKEKDTISFPYFVNQRDEAFGDIKHVSKKQSLTARIINQNKARLLSTEEINHRVEQTPGSTAGSPCKAWVGVPLRIRNDVIGALILQNYESSTTYTESDIDILNSVSEFVAMAIERKRSEEEIRQNEQLTNAFFKISNAVNTTRDLSELYKSIHHSLSNVIDLTNFIIGLSNKKDNKIFFAYFEDQFDDLQGQSITLGPGSIGNDVILSGEPVFLREDDLKKRRDKVQEALGTRARTWMGVPLKVEGEVIGYMAAQSYTDPDLFDQRDVEIFAMVSEQVALAIDRKRSQEELKQNEKLTSTLFKISNAVNTTDNLDDLYKSIHQSLGDVIDIPNFAIGNYDPNTDTISYPYYIDETGDVYQEIKNVSNSGIVASDVINQKKPFLYTKQELINRAKNIGKKSIGKIAEQWLGVPLKIKNEALGVIVVQHYKDPDYYSQKDMDLIVAVSDQIAIAIDRKRTQDEIRQNEMLTQTLFQISNAANTSDNLDDLYQSIYNCLNTLITLPNFFIAIVDPDKKLMHFPFYIDEHDDQETLSAEMESYENSTSNTSRVIATKKPVFLTDKMLLEKQLENKVVGTLSKIWLGVPLIIRETVIGVIAVQHYSDPEYFTQKDMELLVAVSDQIALALDRKKAQEIIIEREKQILELSGQTEEFSLVAASIITMKDEKKIFEYISSAIVEISDYERLIMAYFIDTPPYVEILGLEGINPKEIDNIRKKEVPKKFFDNIFKTGKKVGNFARYLPYTLNEVLGENLPLFECQENLRSTDEWHPGDILLLPMNDENGNLMGVISVDHSKSGKKPTPETVRPLEIFSSLISQIIIVRKIQNELKDHKENLEKKVTDRTKELTTEIQERIQIEKKLKKAKIQAEAGAQAKIEFLTNMSHEIRTPINGIMGMAELAMDYDLEDELKNILDTIDTEANQLLGIINEILDFSKIEAGKLSLEKIDFNLRHTFEQTCSSLFLGMADKGIEFASFLSTKIPTNLIGDPGRLRQILVNLTSNSIKFTHEGEIFIKGELIKETPSHVEIKFIVKDTGIGIPKEKQKTIFDSFSQADGSTTRKYGGTGLGTTISKQLVELMGGTIGVESQVDKGSTFWFIIPFEKQIKKDESKIRNDSILKDLRILIIDENQTNRYIFDQYLTAYGCSCVLANGPLKGIAALHDSNDKNNPLFDIIIESYKMAEMNGFKLAKKIRSFKGYDKIPIILLTSMGALGDANRCKDLGINGYLPKPVKRDELKTAILSVLGKTDTDPAKGEALVTRYTLSEDMTKHFRILLVEDYPTNQKIATKYLQKAGYHVILAKNGLEAVELFKKKQFNLVLMDIQMPEMDGYEATRLIREYESKLADAQISDIDNTKTPIIAMTAHAIKGYKEKCIKAGMDDYITKPITRALFLERVRKWVIDAYEQNVEEQKKLDQMIDPHHANGNNDRENDSTPFNFDIALKEFEHDEAFLFEVIEEFFENITSQLIVIEKAISDNDAQTIEREAHAIKGGAANLTAMWLSKTAHDLELLGKSGQLHQSAAVFKDLLTEFDTLKFFIQSL